MSDRTVDDLETILNERLGTPWWLSIRAWVVEGDTFLEALEALELATRPEVEPQPVSGLAITWDGTDQALEAIQAMLPAGWAARPEMGPTPYLMIGKAPVWQHVAQGQRVAVIDGHVVVL